MATSTDRTQPLALTAHAPPQPTPPPSPAPARTAPTPKFGLAWRIFLGTALVVAVVLVVTLAVASTVASNAADESIRVGLEQTGRRVSDILAEQRDKMTRLAQLYAAQPSFGSTVGGAIVSNDSSTLLDQASTAADELGASWTQIIGPDGVRLVKSDDPSAPRQDLSSSSLVIGALEGKPTSGFGVLSNVGRT